jgi:hypothetical protein
MLERFLRKVFTDPRALVLAKNPRLSHLLSNAKNKLIHFYYSVSHYVHQVAASKISIFYHDLSKSSIHIRYDSSQIVII